jgi:hypothetical protein
MKIVKYAFHCFELENFIMLTTTYYKLMSMSIKLKILTTTRRVSSSYLKIISYSISSVLAPKEREKTDNSGTEY